MKKTTRLKKPQVPELEQLYLFDELGGRPKYGDEMMTSETNIPSFDSIKDETHSAVVAETSARVLADRALQGEIDLIKAASDVVDIVGTYAELEAYDTSTLNDNDIIKVLADETHDNAMSYYRWSTSAEEFSYIGSEAQGVRTVLAPADFDGNLATFAANNVAGVYKFVNTSNSNLELLPKGVLENDNYSLNIKAGEAIHAVVMKQAGSGDKIFVFGAADGSGYLRVALYEIGSSPVIKVYPQVVNDLTTNSSSYMKVLSAKQGKVLKDTLDGRIKTRAGAPTTSTVGTVGQLLEDTTNGKLYQCTGATGGVYTWEAVGKDGKSTLFYFDSDDTLTAVNTPITFYKDKMLTQVLTVAEFMEAAKNGEVILVRVFQSNPTDPQQHYNWQYFPLVFDEDDSMTEQLHPIHFIVFHRAGFIEFTWNNTTTPVVTKITAIPTVVQTAGTSTTNVMSQDATGKLVYANPAPSYQKTVKIGKSAAAYESDASVAIGQQATASGMWAVALGYLSTAAAYSIAAGVQASASGQYAEAFGRQASAGSKGSIALGAYSSASSVGEMNIGSSIVDYGYNSSNYRLLTGLYDPQNAHDAATKGYVDTAVAGAGGTFPVFIDSTLGAGFNMYKDAARTQSCTFQNILDATNAGKSVVLVRTQSGDTIAYNGVQIFSSTSDAEYYLQVVSSTYLYVLAVDPVSSSATFSASYQLASPNTINSADWSNLWQ